GCACLVVTAHPVPGSLLASDWPHGRASPSYLTTEAPPVFPLYPPQGSPTSQSIRHPPPGAWASWEASQGSTASSSSHKGQGGLISISPDPLSPRPVSIGRTCSSTRSTLGTSASAMRR